jgi:hypothetical protein
MKGSLSVIVEGEEGNRGESLGNRDEAGGNGSAEQRGESSGLLCREEGREGAIVPWELLRSVQAKSEGKAEAARLPIGEAGRP